MKVIASPLLAAAVLALAGAGAVTGCTQTKGVPPEQVVDFIHSVIEADRTVYTREVVNRLQNEEKVIEASEHFKEDRTLPLPSQMLRMGARLASDKGRFRYALISLWAINKANAAKSPFEKEGLEAVGADPTKPYRKYESVAGRRYFMAVYPDRAVVPACVTCHNEHKESPRRDFKLGDVMGGLVITLPLE
jgi:Protein of unknown function (DUF3365)